MFSKLRLIYFLCFIAAVAHIKAQSFVVSEVSTSVNGNVGQMKGVPGDFFTATVVVSNNTDSAINVVMNRFNNDIPSYWALCYCYIQCHSPKEDSIMISLQPSQSDQVILLFRTDSVNPGIAYASFHLYQVGYENIKKTLHLTASTINDVGISTAAGDRQPFIFPNPVREMVYIGGEADIFQIDISDISGRSLPVEAFRSESTTQLDLKNFHKGIYLLRIQTSQGMYTRRLVKE
jgi:hypothetical protein